MATHFSIEAEYAHTMLGRRALVVSGLGTIPFVIGAARLDPDANQIIVTASTPQVDLPLRFAPTDVIVIEHERTAL